MSSVPRRSRHARKTKKRVFTLPLIGVLLIGAALVVYAVSEEQIDEIKDLPSTLQQLITRKATVFGVVEEDAVAPETFRATVFIDGKSSRANERGEYSISEVSPGRHTLTVEAADHEKFQKEIEVIRGRNRADVLISLTPQETLERWFAAYKLGRYEEAYEYVHPEDKALVSEKEYADFFKNFFSARKIKIVSFEVGEPKILDRWLNASTEQVYRGIAEADVTMTFSSTKSGSAIQSEEQVKMHLAKVNRQWKGFWSKP